MNELTIPFNNLPIHKHGIYILQRRMHFLFNIC
jgi:hypothetical protein